MKSRPQYVFIALAAFFSCSTNDSATTFSRQLDFAFPLTTGNRWEFRRTWCDTNGTILDSSTITMTVGEQRQLGAEIGYTFEYFPFLIFPVHEDATAAIWCNKPDGLYLIEALGSPPSLWVLRTLPYPTFSGDSVRFAGQTIKAVAANEPVVVAAGSFSCVRYDVLGAGPRDIVGGILLAPNIGIVKAWGPFDPPRRFVYELISYTLN